MNTLTPVPGRQRALKRTPKWKTICGDLSEEARERRFGDRFYTTSDIVRKYRVSDITARRVLTELQNAGVVEKIQKRGTVVRNSVRKGNLTVVLSSAIRSFDFEHSRVYAGMLSASEKSGVTLSVISERHLGTVLQCREEQTAFLIYPFLSDEAATDTLRRNKIPHVLVKCPAARPGSVSVRINGQRGAFLAVSYLAELGHRKIAFITGSITKWFLPRLKGYMSALKKHRIKFDWELVRETSGLDAKEDHSALEELLSLSSPPTAVFTASDERAIHLLEYMRSLRIRSGPPLSIVGYDNLDEARYTTPALTTVETNLKKLGEESVRLLIQMLDNPQRKRWSDVVIQPELVIRESAYPLEQP